MDIIWKPVPGYIEYEVSNLGDVRKRAYKIVYPEGDYSSVPAKALKLFVGPGGRMFVTIRHAQMGVHRLVAMAFVPNPEEYTVVNHKDGNFKNNHADNLEWVPRKFYVASSENSQTIKFGGFSGRRIKCIEDNIVFISIRAAADYYNFNYTRFAYILNHKRKNECVFKGKTFVFAPNEEVTYMKNLPR